MAFIITVDGPAASGKTSVSRELARRLGWKWVSTGAFYRGLAYVVHETGTSATEEPRIAALAVSRDWEVRMDDDNTKVIFNGKDVTSDIFQEAVGTMASRISQLPTVREKLLEPQRACAKNLPGLVAEGRDCGTVVFPDAELKFYITADSEARAQRRALEHGAAVEGIKAAQQSRDKADSQRQVAPLKVADGAHTLDTSDMTLDQVVDRMESLVRARMAKTGLK